MPARESSPFALRENRPRDAAGQAGRAPAGWRPAFARARGSLSAMTEPLYEHGNFADLIGYRLTAWREGEAGSRSRSTRAT